MTADNPGVEPKLRRAGPGIPAVVGCAFAAAVLLAPVPFLADIRTRFDPVGPLSPTASPGVTLNTLVLILLCALGSTVGLVAMISGTIIALVAAGRRRDAAFVGVTVLGASILAQGLKYSFHAPRPAAADSVAGLVGSVEVAMALAAGAVIAMSFLTRWRRWGLLGLAVVLVAVASQAVGGRLLPVETGFDAFPSSHAMCSMALVAAVTALAWRGTGVRHPVLAGLFLYAVGLGFARVCLGVHLPSDVVAGWCIALAWTIGCRVVWVAAVRTAPLEPRRHLPPS